jgi:hypothetical protein
VDERQQKNILNTLCKNARSIFKVHFRSTEHYDEELNRNEWPFWRTQHDASRKIMFGTYLGNALPPPLVTAIRRIPDDRFRSFFMQRCVVYHNTLYAKSPAEYIQEGCRFRVGDNAAAKLTIQDFTRIDVSIPVSRLIDTAPAAPVEPASPPRRRFPQTRQHRDGAGAVSDFAAAAARSAASAAIYAIAVAGAAPLRPAAAISILRSIHAARPLGLAEHTSPPARRFHPH